MGEFNLGLRNPHSGDEQPCDDDGNKRVISHQLADLTTAAAGSHFISRKLVQGNLEKRNRKKSCKRKRALFASLTHMSVDIAAFTCLLAVG